jgi:putative FmdB family regulatory protein
MPTYDYECDSCGKTLEIFQRITDDPLRECPACGKQSLRRLFGTGAAIVFKGSGFYQTDYRSPAYKSAAEKESKDSKPASDSGDKTKPATGGEDAKSASPKPEKSKD